MATFQRTVASYRPGARTMPGEYYTSPAILAEEMERIFARGWHEGPPDRTTPLRGLGGRVDGVFTETFVARAADLVKAPAHMDAIQASTPAAFRSLRSRWR